MVEQTCLESVKLTHKRPVLCVKDTKHSMLAHDIIMNADEADYSCKKLPAFTKIFVCFKIYKITLIY